MNRSFAALMLIGTATLLAGADKAPKPGSSYTWKLPNGAITITVGWSNSEGVLSGTLRNGTSLTLALATIHLRQYRQPLSGIIVDSPIGQVSNVPSNNTAVFDAIGAKTSVGCAIVIDSVELILEDASGNRGSTTLKTKADAQLYWYSGSGCYWEERKYKKSNK
jgi:hypothetical protein